MRLTTKFSAFVTLLTSLTIFVTLIGASLSFYNGIQLKMENRVMAVATMLDNRLVNALGIRVAVVQAGLTLVGTSWIKQLDVEVIKLHPGLSRNIEKRSENQLLVQSLVEACKGMPVQVFATGVRSRSEWQVLSQCGVTGGQGEFFAASQPLDTNVKKYSQRYSV